MNNVHTGIPAPEPPELKTGTPSRRERTAWPKSLFSWLGVFVFLGLFFFYPLARILWVGLSSSPELIFSSNAFLVIRDAVFFTFYQSVLSTLLTLALGLPAAYLFARYHFHGRSFLRTLTAIPFMLPTVVVAAGFTALLGPRGWVNLGLMDLLGFKTPPIVFAGTLGAILLAHIFYNTSIVIRIVGNALAQLDPRLEQAALTLGAKPGRVFRQITLPLLRPSILAAALLVFIFDFTSFGVVLLLGGTRFSTLEVEIYKQAISFFNLPLAVVLSLIQLLFTLAFSFPLHPSHTPQHREHPSACQSIHPSTQLRPALVRYDSLHFSFCFLCITALLPAAAFLTRLEANQGQRGQVQYGLTGDYYRELFINQRGSVFYVPPFKALGNSLGYAALTVIPVPAARFPGRGRPRPSRPARASARPIPDAAAGCFGGDAGIGSHHHIQQATLLFPIPAGFFPADRPDRPHHHCPALCNPHPSAGPGIHPGAAAAGGGGVGSLTRPGLVRRGLADREARHPFRGGICFHGLAG